jgi:uncharacterized protein YbjT (DUF2867 family)
MTILIVGATGTLGGQMARLLAERKKPTRAPMRGAWSDRRMRRRSGTAARVGGDVLRGRVSPEEDFDLGARSHAELAADAGDVAVELVRLQRKLDRDVRVRGAAGEQGCDACFGRGEGQEGH